jgi:hypothetical protein
MDITRLDRALAALNILPLDQIVKRDELVLQLPPTDAVYVIHELTWPVTSADFIARTISIPRKHLECVTSMLAA